MPRGSFREHDARLPHEERPELVPEAAAEDEQARDEDGKPLDVVINYNMDIGDYMEYSGSGFYLVDPSNEAFKFMINYLVYGHTR